MLIDIAENYNKYFASHLYDQRYPRANPRVLALIIEQLNRQGAQVLDFGCGNGRYSAPLLQNSNAHITAYDICAEGLRELSERQAAFIAAGRLHPLVGDLSVLKAGVRQDQRFDLAIMMFGVLGHIGPQSERLRVLTTVRNLLRPGGRLILTVPNARRRFHKEQARAGHIIGQGGDIFYERTADNNTVINMYYHLYTHTEFKQELLEAGFNLVAMQAESIFPESAVVKSTLFAALDRLLVATAPLDYAYGLLAIVEA